VVWREIGGISDFWCFWAKLAIVDRVSRAPVMVGSAGKFEGVPDDVGDEKIVMFCEISLASVVALVVHVVVFFSFPGSAGVCDEATQVGELISRCWGVTVLVCVPMVARDVEGMTGTEIDGDEGSWCQWQLVWVLKGFIWMELSAIECNMESRGIVWVATLGVVVVDGSV
jgi:hypothetical protein